MRSVGVGVVTKRCLIVLLMAIPLLFSSTVTALTDSQKKALLGGGLYANTEDSCIGSTSSASITKLTSGSVYILGDSITTRAYAKYKEVFGAKGITSYINGLGGASWTSGSNGSTGSGLTPSPEGSPGSRKTAAAHDKDEIANSNAIVIALGTNGSIDRNPVAEVIDTIRLYNSTAPIWWINVASRSSSNNSTKSGTFNPVLETLSQPSSKNFKVIDWLKTVNPNAVITDNVVQDINGYLSDDVHPTSTGTEALVNLVSGALVGGVEPSAPVLSTGGCSCSASTTLSLAGSDNEESVWSFFIAKGLPPNGVAGLMGNLKAESEFNPHLVEKKSGRPESPELPTEIDSNTNQTVPASWIRGNYGYGLAQWTSVGRQQRLIDIAKTLGKSTGDLELQLEFIWSELQTSYIEVLTKIRDPSVSLNDASDKVIRKYEAPAKVEERLQGRRDLGAGILNRRSGTSVSTGLVQGAVQGNTAGCGSVGGSCGAGVTDPSGYSFPLAPQTRAVGGIIVGQTATRHGDGTPAFDLFSPIDSADVYAISDGCATKINKEYHDVPGCSTIMFLSDDGFYYWYGHLKNVTITAGTRITAGQQIAQIADSQNFGKNCRGSASHLHIDRGCVINGVPQTGGRDECRDPDFIPFLSSIYERLPAR